MEGKDGSEQREGWTQVRGRTTGGEEVNEERTELIKTQLEDSLLSLLIPIP